MGTRTDLLFRRNNMELRTTEIGCMIDACITRKQPVLQYHINKEPDSVQDGNTHTTSKNNSVIYLEMYNVCLQIRCAEHHPLPSVFR